MPDPLTIQTARDYKARLLTLEGENMRELRDSWLLMEERLTPAMYLFALKVESGEVRPDAVAVLHSDDFRSLIRQTTDEVEGYAAYAAARISDFQFDLGLMGLDYGRAALTALGKETFTDLPPEFPTGKAGNGDTLDAILKPAARDSMTGIAEAVAAALLEGAAAFAAWAWINRLRQGMSQGFNRILSTARTEPFRTYRETQRDLWKENRIKWYARVAQHDTRVCPGCLFSEGETYLIENALDEHVQGRCALIPVLTDNPPADWLYGASWFMTQPPDYQESILGPGRYTAWQEGKFELDNAWKRTFSPEWGASVQSKPLYELLGNPNPRSESK